MNALVRPPQQERSRQTLAAIVRATETLLERKPFSDISIAEIVSEAGCTSGPFYARFTGKDALLPYLYDKYDADLTDHIERLDAAQDWARLDLAATVRLVLREAVRSYAARPHLLREIMLFARRSPQLIGPEIRARRERLQGVLIGRIARFRDQIRHPDPHRAAAFAFFSAATAAREMILFGHAPLAQSAVTELAALEVQLSRQMLTYLTFDPETSQ